MTTGNERCWWCGAPALRLCDGLLAAGDSRMRSLAEAEWPEGVSTCDAPMCNECARTIRTTLVLPPKDRRATGEYFETIDACPFCVAIEGKRLGPLVNGSRTMLTSDEHREKCREHARSNFRPRIRIVT